MKYILPVLFAFCSMTAQIPETEISVSPLLKGTLFSPPNSTGPTKLVILVAGSGPTNRSGNQVGAMSNCLRYLAQGLASNGITVFSYDKRLFAEFALGTVDEKAMRFDHMIDDAKTVIGHFKKDPRFDRIIVAGHSEGALVGMAAAHGNADAYISIAGPGRPIDEVLLDQLSKISPSRRDEIRRHLQILKSGQTFTPEDGFLSSIFRESGQPFMISWMQYDPGRLIAKLDIPVLIVNGTKDLQVAESEAHLLKKAKPDAQIAIIPNMNHVFKLIEGGEEDNKASYNDRARPVSAELVTGISKFIKSSSL